MTTNFLSSVISDGTVLFFDLDGTLIDTDYANYLAYEKAIQTIAGSNFNLPEHDGRFTRSLLKTLIHDMTETDYETVIALKERYYHGLLPETKPNNAVSKILCTYSATHQTVLVTNCRQKRALAILDYHRLTDKFSSMFFRQIGGERVNKFAYAIAQLGVDPQRVVAFENEAEEIGNARRACITNIVKF